MMRVNPEITMGELVKEYPQVLPVFAANGFRADSGEALWRQVEPSLKLQTVLKARKLNQSLFLEMLESRIEETREQPLIATETPPEGKLDFLVYIVCPLKHLFKDGLEAVLQEYRKETGKTFKGFVPMGCGGTDPYEDIWQVERIEDFPDLVVSVGFDNLFKQRFLDEYVAKGYFQAVQPQPVAPAFAECGLADPEGWHSIYGVFPYVMMVDRTKLGDLPSPQRWSDLLNPLYRRKIIIGGSWDDLSEALLLNFYKDFGEEGLRKLAENVKDAWHASKMAKIAGTGHPDGAAIYVAPWFFAETSPHKEIVSIIWPEEGALVSPMYMLVKAAKIEELRVVVDYVTGTGFGQQAAETRWPMLNPGVVNPLPENAKFKWLGWDYIRSAHVEYLIEHTRKLFLDAASKG